MKDEVVEKIGCRATKFFLLAIEENRLKKYEG
jgi:hypothetical protein